YRSSARTPRALPRHPEEHLRPPTSGFCPEPRGPAAPSGMIPRRQTVRRSRGSNGICSVSLHLIVSDNSPADFQFWDSSGIGKIDGQKVFDNLIKVAELVASFFKK